MKAFLVASAQRIFAVLALCFLTHMSWELILQIRDGAAYLHWAKALAGLESLPTGGDRQYFIGYPMALAMLMRLFPPIFAFHTLQLLSIAGILWYGRKIFSESTILWFTLATPMFLLFSNLNMTENLVMFLLFLILFCYQKKYFWILSCVLGFALWVRPHLFAFLWAACFGEMIRQRMPLKVWIPLLLLPSLFVLGFLFYNQTVFGDPFENFHLYAQQEASRPFLQIPFVNFFSFMADPTVRAFNKIYVGGCFLFSLLGLGLFLRKKAKDPVSYLYALFASLYFIFIMTVSYRWAFLEIPRYMIPLYPAAWASLEGKWLRNRYVFAVACILSFVFAVYFEARGDSLRLLL